MEQDTPLAPLPDALQPRLVDATPSPVASTANQPAAKQPIANQPAANQPAASQPIAKELSEERALRIEWVLEPRTDGRVR